MSKVLYDTPLKRCRVSFNFCYDIKSMILISIQTRKDNYIMQDAHDAWVFSFVFMGIPLPTDNYFLSFYFDNCKL